MLFDQKQKIYMMSLLGGAFAGLALLQQGIFFVFIATSILWASKEFPLAGSFRYPVSNACPNKVPLIKGHTEITNGQHYVKIKGKDTYGDRWKHIRRFPPDQIFVQVHHFKWDSSVINRVRDVSRLKKSFYRFFDLAGS